MINDWQLLVRSTIKLYIESAKDASKGFVKNWTVVVGAVILVLLFNLIMRVISGLPLGMAGGFILGLLAALFTGQYYSWLQATLLKDRLLFNELLKPDLPMFIAVVSVSFLLWIIFWLSSSLGSTAQTRPFLIIVYFLIVFAFNSLPEAVYIRGAESIAAFSEALRFMKENWIEWYIPLILLATPILVSEDPASLLLRFALIYPLFPALLILQVWMSVFLTLIPVPLAAMVLSFLLGHWFMLFRGFLYKNLDGSTRRRRIYLAKQD